MLEVSAELPLLLPLPNKVSTLYWAKRGQDFTEENAVALPLGNRKSVKRIVYFNEFAHNIRWDPCEEAMLLPNMSVKLSKITAKFALKKMRAKLFNAKNESSDIVSNAISNSISNSISDKEKKKAISLLSDTELCQQYNALFSVRVANVMNYNEWLTHNEHWHALVKEQPIKFSIVMPVYKPNLEHFREAIESVLKQTYSNWELCLADDCSGDENLNRVIEEYSAQDSRIKCVFRKDNGHISAASNSALSIATGEYIVLLDHDDLLASQALNEVAVSLAEHKASIVYSDEDKIDSEGVRFDPHFKSDFNEELILSQNYISHLGVYKKSLVDAVGGFRLGVEGSQDYDLLLRCLAAIEDKSKSKNTSKGKSTDVIHITKILYHWRAVEGSTALAAGEKGYTDVAGLKALQDTLKQRNKNWLVEHGELPNTYKVTRPVQENDRVSIIIPTKDQLSILKTCIDSILAKTSFSNYEIVIVDNGSVEEETLAYFTALELKSSDLQKTENNSATTPDIRILRYNKPFNYSAINNYAVSQCENSDLVLLLNNDVEVINENWLTEMVSLAQQPDVGCVGAKLYYSNGSIQHGGVILGIGGVAGHAHKYFQQKDSGYFCRLKLRQDLSAVTAACLLVKKSVYLEVGGLNENDLTIAFNDVDFCLKVRALGLRNIWTPFAELYHHESISRGAENTPEKVERFNKEVAYMQTTWGNSLLNDPYYNPNLSLILEDMSLR
jgi:glycosyltransferase involved in cell wall biosynthesis